jgi:hypothetical protein
MTYEVYAAYRKVRTLTESAKSVDRKLGSLRRHSHRAPCIWTCEDISALLLQADIFGVSAFQYRVKCADGDNRCVDD